MAIFKENSQIELGTTLSPFPTKRRKEVLDLLANIVIFPAYLLVSREITQVIGKSIIHNESISWYLWIGSWLPILNMLNAEIYWRPGFWKRKRLFAIAAALLLFFLIRNEIATLQIFLATLDFLMFEFFLQRLLARNKFLANLVRPGIVILVTANVILAIFLYVLIFHFSTLYDVVPRWLIKTPLFVSVLGILPFPLYFGISDIWKSYLRESRFSLPTSFGFLLKLVSRVGVFVGFCGTLLVSSGLYLPSILGLALMLLVANPNDLLSQQRANLRHIFKRFREGFIEQLILPRSLASDGLFAIWKGLATLFQRNAPWLLLVIAWGTGSIFLPLYLYTQKIENNLLILMSIGIVAGLVIATLTMIYWVIRIAPKHVVVPFRVITGSDDSSLEVIASLTTQAFVERLKYVSLLLSMRQIENLSLRDNHDIPFFVTSGQDQDLFDRVRTLGNIDTKEIRIPFGNLFAPLMNNLVETRVRGTVQRKEDRTIAIWVEYEQKGGRTIEVDMAFLPENSTLDIDRNLINEIALTLAVKLVFSLGEHSHLASTWESLKFFLNGLDAAYNRNWWHAISCYRKAVHMEEAARNAFGYGYYHLGATLLFQGKVYQGMEYLQLAEKVGPPLPETQYMLALGRFHLFRDDLHMNRSRFADIVIGCRAALRLRRAFPEAYHLLGTAYYQRGRLRERTYTKYYKDLNESPYRIDPVARGYADDYHKARNYFQKAILHYDCAIRKLPGNIHVLATVFDEKTRLVQDRMSASHRLADTLRCLDRFAEAETCYEEMLTAYPLNNRTWIDIAKTYCLAGNWGQADQFLRMEILNEPELEWNKSANFYRGWSLIGGVAESEDPLIRVIDWLIKKYEKFGNRGHVATPKENLRLLENAFDCLDFAYHQYPPYTYRWRQLDWLPAFQDVLRRMEGSCAQKQLSSQFYSSPVPVNECSLAQLKYWLAWRILGNAYIPDLNINKLAKSIAGSELDPSTVPLEAFNSSFVHLLEMRKGYYEQLLRDESERNIKSFERRSVCMNLAQQGWEEIQQMIDFLASLKDNRSDAPLTFRERWALDLFAELSLLTVKLMVEGKAYDLARQVAHETGNILNSIIVTMLEPSSVSLNISLGSKVVIYQLSSLYAWEAYSLLAESDDIATQAREIVVRGERLDGTHLEQVETLIQKSKNLISVHPLACYTEALLQKKLGLFREAADNLIALLQQISPLNPHKYITHEAVKPPTIPVGPFSPTRVDDLSKRERIQGHLQFDNIVNQVQIHVSLASIFVSLNEMDLVADHLMLAISHCPYEDAIASLFLDLTHIFDQQHRFDEALTATEEAKNLHLRLTPFNRQIVRHLEPFILECLLTTNLGAYSDALEKADQLKDMIQFESFIKEHKALILELQTFAKELRSPVLTHAIDQYSRDVAKLKQGFATKAHTRIASFCLRSDLLADYLKPAIKTSSDDAVGVIFASQIIALLSRDMFEQMVFTCDLYNNSAFNWAELDFNLIQAKQDAQATISAMEGLLLSVVPRTTKADLVPYNPGKQLQNLLDPLTWATTNYEKRLANYLDTLAWVLFRTGQIDKLEEAFKILKDVALHFDSGLAIIYYHLARICVRQLEVLWQGAKFRRGTKSVSARTANKVGNLLRSASLYYRHANNLDRNHSLQSRLCLLDNRINSYRQTWSLYQGSV